MTDAALYDRRQPDNYWVRLHTRWLVAVMRLINSTEIWYIAGAAKPQYHTEELKEIGPRILGPTEIARLQAPHGASAMEHSRKVLAKFHYWLRYSIDESQYRSIVEEYARAIERAEAAARARAIDDVKAIIVDYDCERHRLPASAHNALDNILGEVRALAAKPQDQGGQGGPELTSEQ